MLAYYCEWIGCVFGLSGAFLLAFNSSVSRYGWVSFSIANIALLTMAIDGERSRLIVMYIGFAGSSTLGLYKTGFFKKQLRRVETGR